MNYQRLDNETDEELIYRICQQKDLIGSWQDVADILNQLLGQEYTESKYRKQYTAFIKMFNSNENKLINDEYINEIKLQKQELKKERQKLSDERIEFNKQIREQARRESFEELIEKVIKQSVEPIDFKPREYEHKNINSENDILLHFTDLHTGVEIDNWFNQFDEKILLKRVENYVTKIIEIKDLHKSQDCYIVVSELISGLIHNNLRIQNNMDLIQQFKYISELLCRVFIELQEHFDKVYVYTVIGNHSRISPKKEDSLQGENFDLLFPFYASARLQNYKNIIIEQNNICNDIAIFNIRGNVIMASHGDKDTPNKVVENFTMMFDIKPKIVLLGHRHYNAITTVGGSKVIQSGSFCGIDEYALSLRKIGKPEQYVNIVNEDGLVCSYDIRLD